MTGLKTNCIIVATKGLTINHSKITPGTVSIIFNISSDLDLLFTYINCIEMFTISPDKSM
jgi:hypothetical protein